MMRVLIAEDNSLVTMMREKLGRDVEEACQKLPSQEEIDLALRDINMQKRSGIEVLQTVGQQISIPRYFSCSLLGRKFY